MDPHLLQLLQDHRWRPGRTLPPPVLACLKRVSGTEDMSVGAEGTGRKNGLTRAVSLAQAAASAADAMRGVCEEQEK